MSASYIPQQTNADVPLPEWVCTHNNSRKTAAKHRLFHKLIHNIGGLSKEIIKKSR